MFKDFESISGFQPCLLDFGSDCTLDIVIWFRGVSVLARSFTQTHGEDDMSTSGSISQE